MLADIVLIEAGLDFERINIDEHTKIMANGGDYRTINPLGYVPALQVDDGTVLTEGAAIVQYIADKVPATNLVPPNGTLERTKLQSWLNFLSTEVQMGCFCPLFDPAIPDPVKTVFRQRLESRLAHLDRHLAQNGYLMGKRFSVADLYLFVVSNWARPVKFDLSSYPNILILRKRVGARPAVQTALTAEALAP